MKSLRKLKVRENQRYWKITQTEKRKVMNKKRVKGEKTRTSLSQHEQTGERKRSNGVEGLEGDEKVK